MTSFAALGVDPRLVDALDRAGITAPFPIQALTIPDAVAGRDVCGKAKTGSGKTLAFGLPLLATAGDASPNHPHAVVLVPTRELALQVSEVLAPLGAAVGCRVVAVYGGASMDRQRNALAKGADVLVATPGRLIDFIDNGDVRLDEVRAVVLDEADRMADMGFLPQVEWLLRRITSPHQTLLFSATLDGAVDHVVRRHLHEPVFHEVVSATVTVDEMAHRFVLVHQLDKVKVVAAITNGAQRSLVFVRTKRGADRLVEQLGKEGVRAAAIHGDLRQQMREKSLAAFAAGTLPVLVATDVAARGIHVDDIDIVVHYDPPEDAKTYLHRSGRTARAGESGLVVTLVLWDQELEVRRMQRRLGLDLPIVEMLSNDSRLADLVGWDPIAAPEPRAAKRAYR
ncbi:MAG TPA: DEAD/DEAH box helicase [Acidimicrobiales bacterium]|nr:DEAD/DEAH box helicase [Acidimicrobiales bacterium]